MAIYVFAMPLDTVIGGFYFRTDLDFDEYRNQAGGHLEINGGNLRVLVLTDTHFLAIPVGVDSRTRNLVTQLVKKTQPDLILMLGDNIATFFNHTAQRQMIRFMDSFEIPWAPLFGNHDHHGKATTAYISQMLINESKHSLFVWGPNNIGVAGNYFIEITRNQETIHTLFLMSSQESPWFQWVYAPYTVKQVQWYEWAVNGIGANIPSTLLLHKPLPIFYYAYNRGEVFWGQNREGIWAADYDNGLWEKILALGSTQQIIAGHDHMNDFKVRYQGVYLSYAIASNKNLAAFGSYGSIAGGKLLTINQLGEVTQERLMVHGPRS